MDKRIRQAIHQAMIERGLINADVARELKVTPQAVGQVINGDRGKLPQSLIDVLRAVGLRLVVVDEQGKEVK